MPRPRQKSRPADNLATLTRRIGTDRHHNPSQFYRTPPEAAIAFLNREARRIRFLSSRVAEVASGEGDLARVIARYGFDVAGSDIRRGAEIYGRKGVDFLKTKRLRAPVIITNPPFGALAAAFIRHAKRLGALYMALLLPSGFFQGADDNIAVWRELPATRIWPIGFRLDFTRAGKALPQAFSWFVWDWTGIERRHDPRPPRRAFGEAVADLMPALVKPTRIEVPA